MHLKIVFLKLDEVRPYGDAARVHNRTKLRKLRKLIERFGQAASCVREVIVLADGDEPSEAAARDAALRWKREGRQARIARPQQGLDFNDLLLGRLRLAKESAA